MRVDVRARSADNCSYNPVFMNDAIYSQEVLQTYGNKSYERLKATHQKYDPNGFFATRQDGFKFT